jgi:hypothetical protein
MIFGGEVHGLVGTVSALGGAPQRTVLASTADTLAVAVTCDIHTVTGKELAAGVSR